MKTVRWTPDTLKQLIGQEENYQLEFKSSRALMQPNVDEFFDKLSCAVSAFLNSDGGTLIIGIEEPDKRDERHKKHAGRAVALSPGVPRSSWIGDRVANKLCDRVHPAVASYVRVYPVTVSHEGDEELMAFVVEVKPGITAYQAADKKYYSRRSFSSEPMEDKDVRLRMLADDRPRAELRINARASPADRSWRTLEEQIQDYEDKRAKARELRAVKPDPTALDAAELNVVLEAIAAVLRPVAVANITLSVSLVNTGSVTIRRGAVSWTLEQPGETSQITLNGDASSGITEFRCDDELQIPLYPEMQAEIASWSFRVPRGVALEGEESALDVVVYLDGGAPVRQRILLGEVLVDSLEEFAKRLTDLEQKHRFGDER